MAAHTLLPVPRACFPRLLKVIDGCIILLIGAVDKPQRIPGVIKQGFVPGMYQATCFQKQRSCFFVITKGIITVARLHQYPLLIGKIYLGEPGSNIAGVNGVFKRQGVLLCFLP